jgi:signal recognition particle subunit SRP54
MFDRLTSSLSAALKSLSGRGRLTDDNITDTVREVRLADRPSSRWCMRN